MVDQILDVVILLFIGLYIFIFLYTERLRSIIATKNFAISSMLFFLILEMLYGNIYEVPLKVFVLMMLFRLTEECSKNSTSKVR